MCSHALATQYEANARGIFGREVQVDSNRPEWHDGEVSVQYDRFKQDHLTRNAAMAFFDQDGIYPQELDLVHPPVYAFVQNMLDNKAELGDVIETMASFGVDKAAARGYLLEALLSPADVEGQSVPAGAPESGSAWTTEASKQHRKHPVKTYQEHGITRGFWGPGWGWCGLCGGNGCNYCNGQGQVPASDPNAVGQGGAVDAGTADASGGAVDGGATSSVKTADYAYADPFTGFNTNNLPTSVPHSNSHNPASTGWATSQDPQDWGASLITNNFGVTFDAALHQAVEEGQDFPSQASLDMEARMFDATLHDDPEGALPFTDGVNDEEVDPDPLAGNTKNAKAEEMAIVAEFHRTAGGRKLAKESMKDFSYAEQQELINEGQGDRARNFNDLKIAGTHYEMIGDGDDDETILWV